MHTKINLHNPHGYNRWGFAWEHVPKGEAAHLDFGCHDGAFLNTLKDKKIGRLVGVDVVFLRLSWIHRGEEKPGDL